MAHLDLHRPPALAPPPRAACPPPLPRQLAPAPPPRCLAALPVPAASPRRSSPPLHRLAPPPAPPHHAARSPRQLPTPSRSPHAPASPPGRTTPAPPLDPTPQQPGTTCRAATVPGPTRHGTVLHELCCGAEGAARRPAQHGPLQYPGISGRAEPDPYWANTIGSFDHLCKAKGQIMHQQFVSRISR
ncbi:protein TRACHEARY ELEMENT DIFFERENTIATION-RELATED 7A-like [Phragmites australis]|uniref:protein TRACHEARY ELEMENT DIFFERENTIATION-RELATED 7A-like n=1 Tax=Phragmites australis TaxID=29695 RepID=UPI002D77870E|nr:protein TRACHEARY ELEMENT DIFFERENTIATION-RELATED 7A-like [Phragmites australis]